ncbi:MAG: SDR family oxidoreductase [Deltaproteobacteria bacterium]|nr:SDR family oxidoreductase [Deltaproteobacteria bacterium]
MNLKDKVAIITGASKGIGKAMAYILADEGCHIVCAARSVDKLEQVVAGIRAKGRRALAVGTDVSDRQSVQRMVAAAMAEFGRIDILINNAGGPLAGIPGMARPVNDSNEFFDVMEKMTFINIDDTDWDLIFNINFYGAVYATKAVLPIMMKQGSGHIINTSSKAGKIKADIVPGMIAYATAKGALSRFTEALAYELMCEVSPIRVNAISPGNVAVTMHENLPPEELEGYRKPEDIKDVLLFVLDEEKSVSGEIYGSETMKTWYREIQEGI